MKKGRRNFFFFWCRSLDWFALVRGRRAPPLSCKGLFGPSAHTLVAGAGRSHRRVLLIDSLRQSWAAVFPAGHRFLRRLHAVRGAIDRSRGGPSRRRIGGTRRKIYRWTIRREFLSSGHTRRGKLDRSYRWACASFVERSLFGLHDARTVEEDPVFYAKKNKSADL